MHLRYPRAAVAAEPSPSAVPLADILPIPRTGTGLPRPIVLWASPALSLQVGRLVGVRLVDQTVQVALIKSGEDKLRRVAAGAVLSEFQARTWVQTSRFSL